MCVLKENEWALILIPTGNSDNKLGRRFSTLVCTAQHNPVSLDPDPCPQAVNQKKGGKNVCCLFIKSKQNDMVLMMSDSFFHFVFCNFDKMFTATEPVL